MYRGRIIGIVGPDTPREEIGLLMAGITPDTAAERRDDRRRRPGRDRRRPGPRGPRSEDEA